MRFGFLYVGKISLLEGERETPAKMMRFNDPIMYRCGFNDWIDGMVTDRQAVKNGVNWSSEV